MYLRIISAVTSSPALRTKYPSFHSSPACNCFLNSGYFLNTFFIYPDISPVSICFLYSGIHTIRYFKSYTACFVLLISMPSLYQLSTRFAIFLCLTANRFHPPGKLRRYSAEYFYKKSGVNAPLFYQAFFRYYASMALTAAAAAVLSYPYFRRSSSPVPKPA